MFDADLLFNAAGLPTPFGAVLGAILTTAFKGAAALADDSTDLLTNAVPTTTGLTALAIGFVTVLIGVMGFTAGFAVALTTGLDFSDSLGFLACAFTACLL